MDRKYLISKFKIWDKIERLGKTLILSDDEFEKRIKSEKKVYS